MQRWMIKVDRLVQLSNIGKSNKWIDYWKDLRLQDQIGKHVTLTKEEQMAEDYSMNTHYRDKSGRFVVKIPIEKGTVDIGS